MDKGDERRIRFLGKLARSKGADLEELVEHFGKDYDNRHENDEQPPTAEQRAQYLTQVRAILETVAPLDARAIAAEGAARSSRVYSVPEGEPFDPDFNPGDGRG